MMIDCSFLNNLTRKQLKIYELHDPLFEAIFNHPYLAHLDPDILAEIEKEQRERLIINLMEASTYQYQKQTYKKTKKEIEHTIKYNLEGLVGQVVRIVEAQNKGIEA